ncbi:hypothetical protein H257_11680 [Aphanomyces astaci]|uniref:Complex 1 LYR protein domain-containing protein n=1 Tax=Aphanomyces astaci TaxID=112090 RepID=W4G3Q8_APHAT|nr:hypothetical protein H257_11680 [Aphanomyces astaci]ETV73553.1 hypothetical protein H257_11680 [Aphanomyces astaci]|eukprot:XP_009836979.1 hypothetical protein H257_11680 [Aphanomyces astaci]
MSSASSRALALYRRILRVARTWEGPEKERLYIKQEARRQFEGNRQLRRMDEVENAILQGEQRLEVGLHYKIPYPRPMYADPGTVGGDNNFQRQSNRHKAKGGQLEKKSSLNAFKWK